ncbi:AraC family transcriptional regulator [Azorhizobium sp. AG788]|uniref:AraC family transcriptional regulator n=1 Tax=Azorhizobium sp. AG788 TaxID=2183897 RepID=UPI003139A4CB
MRLNPIKHAERVTGRKQSALIDLWSTAGFAATLSDVTGPHIYNYGELPVATVAITLYDVRRHVLIENGRVRRDGRVAAGQFRIGQPGRSVVVDAVPDVHAGKLVLLYLDDVLLREVGAAHGSASPIVLRDTAWDVEDPMLSLCAQRLVEASALVGSGDSLMAEQFAYTLALHVADRYGAPQALQPIPTLDLGKFAWITDFVRSDPGRAISLADMATIAGMSPSAFIRSFKRATGLTPHRFVMEQRVRVAQDLIAVSEMSIAEIAIEVGFSSQSHMGTAFRAMTGMSPSQYRRVKRGQG